MRNLWLMVSTIAVANLAALLVGLGWLFATERLDLERLHAVHEVFVDPLPIARAKEEKALIEAALAAESAEAQARVGTVPLTAAERLEQRREAERIRQAQTDRLAEETRRIRATLMEEADQLQRDRGALEGDRDAFEQMRQDIIEREDDAQFRQTVDMYQTIPPKQSASMMLELIRDDEMDSVVGYLDAMKPRSAAKVIAEIEKERSELAAELLERLKVYGLIPEADEDPADADADEATDA